MARRQEDHLARERREHAERFNTAMEALGLRQVDVVNRLGLTAQYVNDLVLGRKRIQRQFAHYFQSEFNISGHWLRTGEGDMWHVAPPAEGAREPSVAVPLHTALPTSHDRIGHAGRRETVRLLSDMARPSRGAKRFVYVVPDDEMAPALMKEDRILVESRRSYALDSKVHGKLCALRIGQCSLVRRIEIEDHEYRPWVWLVSPNPDVGRERVRRKDQDHLVIIGTVVGIVWRDVDALDDLFAPGGE